MVRTNENGVDYELLETSRSQCTVTGGRKYSENLVQGGLEVPVLCSLTAAEDRAQTYKTNTAS